ncbi:poly(ADP-ribose) glycohydrolase 1-like isoform X1 [Cynara cardunculus var. scolymus]|uniref:poly(ADP-ribose) glycohydrolase 1-like isoform X1 n=1 Tax=Cynara cardunculus var. scolymus TaxID=59895 RepID=UPI000D627395|nr:poly(ADP-ribose) glycohydrolase 1-like isoform X1 [Cynara cardunculus var. scolymus]XP_024982749.1 poly(ADP-ribose) glycohydrolase 1-like isoform X1 [Cynara cardunculus var. scolymus]
MENREDLNSILEFLPVVLRSTALFWPSQVVKALKALSKGPEHSKVDSGEVLFLAISDIRRSLNLSAGDLAFSTADGFSLFFDDLISRAEANKWFREILPALADSLLRLPGMLEAHYQSADSISCIGARNGLKMGLRLLKSQEAGIVLLSKELIGALLACSFFCLFPNSCRGANHLQVINFDHLFASLYDSYNEKQENKIKCIIHYFERISSSTPVGNVSFERKVLAADHNLKYIFSPKTESWSKSVVSLCLFEVCSSGLIEDHSKEALEVDFANKYFGGGALARGCVQEEIRFMINPELIAGMLFLPSMADNEAIEVVGAERFSKYTGYAASFQYCGDFLDKKDIDIIGRRKIRIIAIDALFNPGERQYEHEFLVREVNKAFCGFSDPCKSQRYQMLFEDNELSEAQLEQDLKSVNSKSDNAVEICQPVGFQDEIGIVTGNWGCGAFGGDPELKAMLQWLAASQALRPFMVYYTFDIEALQKLEQVTQWINFHKWSVGDLWNMLVEYSSQRSKKETQVGFFNWLLPLLSSDDPMMLDVP